MSTPAGDVLAGRWKVADGTRPVQVAVKVLMDAMGITEIKSGRITLSFDAEGRLASVEEFRHHKVLTPTR